MRVKRRELLRAGASVAAGAPLALLFLRSARAEFGALVADPNGILDLPAGFTYQILEQVGADMSDGYRVPGRPDGMECFAGPNGTLVLMRNHELTAGASDGPYKNGQSAPTEAYDAAASGGVTRLVIDAVSFARVSSNLVLAGTTRNCAGGWSPWGWLSCEEDVGGTHGYVFVCSDSATTVKPPQKIASYGRMNHEAATVDPATNIAYLTEDRTDSCFYRFVPKDKAVPFVGKLQALKIAGKTNEDLGTWAAAGMSAGVEWVDVDVPDSASDDVRDQAQAKGAGIVRRGEGIYLEGTSVYFCATTGGPAFGGQIFRLDVAANELVLHGVSSDKAELDMPDNIAVAPWGDVIMAEDGSSGNFLRGLTSTGEVYEFARNAKSNGELAGVCFSPDGKALFVNLQSDGLTLVVTGPFPRAMTSGTGGGGPGSTTGTSAAGGNGASGAATTGAGAASGSGVGSGASSGAASGQTEESGSCAFAVSAGSAGAVAAVAMIAAVVRKCGAGRAGEDDSRRGVDGAVNAPVAPFETMSDVDDT